MFETSCHCGNVKLEVSVQPEKIISCNCSICGRYGAMWSYFVPDQVTITEKIPTEIYQWGDKYMNFHHCPTCGCVTHNSSTEKMEEPIVGVNTRMASRADLDGIKVTMFDGADAWKTVEGHPGWGGW